MLVLIVTVERFFKKNYYYLVTATLFNSSYKTKTGEWYDTKYNGNYQFNILGGKEFVLKDKNKKIGLNGKIKRLRRSQIHANLIK